MSNEDNRKYRKEGTKAFAGSPYDINGNPYSLLGDGEESRKRQQWQYGWDDAKTEKDRNMD